MMGRRPGAKCELSLIPVLALVAVSCVRSPVPQSVKEIPIPAPIAPRVMTLDGIRAALWPKGAKPAFAPSTLAERRAVITIMAELLRRARDAGADPAAGADLDRLGARAAQVGLRLEIWRHAGQTYWALLEEPGARRGTGAYILRVSGPPAPGASEVLLQAPHSYYDTGTGRIALELFFAARERALVRALFTNTVHRYWAPDGPTRRRHNSPADVCHRADHLFQIATAAAAEVLGALVVIQLHGFAGSDTRPGSVISAGDAEASTPLVRRLARKLGPVLGDIKRFPEDIDELGATTNAQGRLLTLYPGARFVHLEMSRAVRDELRANPEVLSQFAAALFSTAAGVAAGVAEEDR